MRFEGIGWANSFGPLVGLAVLAALLPLATVPGATRSQARLAVGIGLAAVLTFVASLVLFGWLYARAGNGLGAGLIRPAAMTALLWGPVLALTWLVRAQGVEKRRGEDMAKRG